MNLIEETYKTISFLRSNFTKEQIELIFKAINEVKGKKLFINCEVAFVQSIRKWRINNIHKDIIELKSGSEKIILKKYDVFRVDLFRNKSDKYLKELIK